jgi:hypothetical protein
MQNNPTTQLRIPKDAYGLLSEKYSQLARRFMCPIISLIENLSELLYS